MKLSTIIERNKNALDSITIEEKDDFKVTIFHGENKRKTKHYKTVEFDVLINFVRIVAFGSKKRQYFYNFERDNFYVNIYLNKKLKCE